METHQYGALAPRDRSAVLRIGGLALAARRGARGYGGVALLVLILRRRAAPSRRMRRAIPLPSCFETPRACARLLSMRADWVRPENQLAAVREDRSLFSIVIYNEFCNSRASAPVNRRNPLTAMWLRAPMRRPPGWARLRLGSGPAMLALRASNSVSSLRKYIAGESRNVSRAQRSTKWCAADPGSFGSLAVPDQRRTAPLRFALHRIW